MQDERPRKSRRTPPGEMRFIEVVAQAENGLQSRRDHLADIDRHIREIEQKLAELRRLFEKHR